MGGCLSQPTTPTSGTTSIPRYTSRDTHSSVRNSRKRSHILYDQFMRKIERNFPELFQVVEFDIEKKLRKRRNMRYNLKKKMCVQIPSFYSKKETNAN